jgi:hypothetical protein
MLSSVMITEKLPDAFSNVDLAVFRVSFQRLVIACALKTLKVAFCKTT